MNNIINILGLIVILTTTNCSNRKQNSSNNHSNSEIIKTQKKCEIGFIDESFKPKLYPFTFEYFNSQKILSYFENDAKVDSFEKVGYNDYKYRIYRFKDNLSYIEFMVKSYDSTEKWFYIEGAEINSNFLKFKNGVLIGMSKEQFIKTLNFNEFLCDTFKVSDGELSTDYKFIFKNNKLQKIMIYGPE